MKPSAPAIDVVAAFDALVALRTSVIPSNYQLAEMRRLLAALRQRACDQEAAREPIKPIARPALRVVGGVDTLKS